MGFAFVAVSREQLASEAADAIKEAFKKVYNVTLPDFTTMEFNEAMERFGSDKPDLRIKEMELKDISDISSKCGFSVFKGNVERGGIVKGFNLKKGQDKMSRKDIDKLIKVSQELGAKGLAWMKVIEGGNIESSISKFFSEDELRNAAKLTAGHLETTLFLSGEGKYKISTLPIQAQYSPIHSIEQSDFNTDGNLDMILLGNDNHFKLRLGKFDANYGALLLGDGKGGFEYVNQVESGLRADGTVSSSLLIDDILYLSIVGRPMETYKISN